MLFRTLVALALVARPAVAQSYDTPRFGEVQLDRDPSSASSAVRLSYLNGRLAALGGGSTTAVSLALGGTGATDAPGARVNLGLTPAWIAANCNVFTAGLQGCAPASGGGTANFLRADGTWAAPPGGGPGGSGTVTGGSGGSTGLTLGGSTTLTLGGTLALGSGGTGATTAAGARVNLGLATVASTGAYGDLTGTPALAAIASSGSASDLAAGTVPAARLPIATSAALGAVKQGSNIVIAGDGTISSTAGGGLPSIAAGAILANATGATAQPTGVPFSNFLGTTSTTAAPGDVVAGHTTQIAALQPSLATLADAATVTVPTTAHAFAWAPAATPRTLAFGGFSAGDTFNIFVTPSVASAAINYPAAARFWGTASPTTPPTLSGTAGVTDVITVTIGPSGTPFVTVGDAVNTASGGPSFSGTTAQLTDGAGNPVTLDPGLALNATSHVVSLAAIPNGHVLGNLAGSTAISGDTNWITYFNLLSSSWGAVPFRGATQETAKTCPAGQAYVSGGVGADLGCGGIGGSGTPVTTIAACNSTQALAMPSTGAVSYDITLTGTCTLTLSGGATGQDVAVRIYARQDATAGRSLVLPTGVKWAGGGTVPTPGTASGNVDIFTIRTPDNGTTYFGDY